MLVIHCLKFPSLFEWRKFRAGGMVAQSRPRLQLYVRDRYVYASTWQRTIATFGQFERKMP